MRRSGGDWEKVGVLLERQSNLNQLRVGTIQVYLVVVAAVLALLGGADFTSKPNSFVVPLGICLLGVGLLVLLYDLRLRARAYAVAAEVARSVPDTRLEPARNRSVRLDEDLLFSMVLMLINSTLVYIGLEHGYIAGQVTVAISAIIAIVIFAAQVVFYCWYWPRLAKDLTAWPDGFVARIKTGDDDDASATAKDA